MHKNISLAVLLVLGCKTEAEKIVEAHKDMLKARLDNAAALSPIVAKEPKLTSDKWPVPGVKWPTNVYTDPSGNAIWAWSHQLVDPCKNQNATFEKDNSGSDYIIFTETRISTTGGLLRYPGCALAGEMELAQDISEKAVKYLEGVQYVLVLRPDVKIEPMLDKAEVDASTEEYLKTGKGKDVEHFVSGRIAGDALLYELATGKLLGGFTFDVKSSDEIEVSGAGIQEMQHDIVKHLEAHIAGKLAL